MTRDELLTAYDAGRRDFHDVDLREEDLGGADLSDADLRGADLRRADLRCADLRCADLSDAWLVSADLRGSRWHLTRLHASGTWSAPPPRCSAGDWHAIVLAPGIVRIGCTTLSVAEWLERGADLAAQHHVSPDDADTLRDWMSRLKERTEWPGWEADT
jgi:hypothetical protein